jgi:hypothetical protein
MWQREDRMNEAVCIGCKCTDSRACPGGCHWLYVDYDCGHGICSSCPEVYEEFVPSWPNGPSPEVLPVLFLEER